MIKSFRGTFAQLILQGRRMPKGFPGTVARVARRKPVQLNNAAELGDLAARLATGSRL